MAEAVGDPPLAERPSGALPLPGGHRAYLRSLRRICLQVNEETPTPAKLAAWISGAFDVKESTAATQVAFLRKVGLVESNDGRVRLPDAMRRWLDCGKHQIPIGRIHRRLRFFGEMLAETVRPRSDDELLQAAGKYGLIWDTPAQVVRRRGWLESGGFIEPCSDGLVITPAGRSLLDRLELEPEPANVSSPNAEASQAPPVVAHGDEVREEDGLEVEVEPADATEIKRPFDPQKIKVQSTPLLVGQMIARMKHGEINVPEFQRKAGIWNAQRRSRLIESLLLRIPIPVFYFAADEGDNWSVVDGLQRTTTIRDFVAGRFALRGLEYLTKYEHRHYAELERPLQRRIEETSLVVNVIQPGTPEEVTFNIFSRINTGGMTLTGQEIRHALHKGKVLGFLKDLADSRAFVEATGGSVSDERMGARECVLRFLAFRDRKWAKYGASDDLDRWLGSAMNGINQMTDAERTSLRKTFERAMRIAHEIFGPHAFRKRYGNDDDRRRPVNKALFEAWSVGLAQALDCQDRLVAMRRDLVAGSYELMRQRDFEAAVSAATGTASKVKCRFGAVEALIEECLHDAH